MTATITSIPASACGHREIVFNVTDPPLGARTLRIHQSDIAAAKPDSFEELVEAIMIVCRHQFLTRRAAGRTQAQALADFVGFTVRV